MMFRELLRGTAAGAVGTLALDVATYTDMMIRGRSSSGVPAKVAGRITESMGIELTHEDGESGKKKAENRQSALGALMGYMTGMGVGVAYGLIRPRLGEMSGLSLPLAGVVVGLAAMAASDVPAITTGTTDPRSWGASGWISDLAPHVVYGVVTALVYEAL